MVIFSASQEGNDLIVYDQNRGSAVYLSASAFWETFLPG